MAKMEHWKRYLPKSGGDQLAFGMMLFLIHMIVVFEAFVILPDIFPYTSTAYWTHFLLGISLYVNVMMSLVYTVTTNSTILTMTLPSILKPGWKFCSSCAANAPPRSFHCWICNTCILRRDHHCVFTGNCIGHANQRHYITFLVMMCVGAAYCNYLNMDHAYEELGGFSFITFVTMLVPIVAWFFGIAKGFTFMIAFISAICLFGWILLIALMAFHMNTILRGQVTHERTQRIRDYDLGWPENLRQVFGSHWYIAWACSAISSSLPSNGLEFHRRTLFENVKDM